MTDPNAPPPSPPEQDTGSGTPAPDATAAPQPAAELVPPEEIADEVPAEPAPPDAVEAPEEAPDAPPPPAKKAALPFKGRVTFPAAPYVQVLAVRSGPGTNYPIIARLPDGSVVTVVKEQGNWGSFQKGGWSSLTYVKKI